MRRSTPFARALGGAALVCAAVGMVLGVARYAAGTPRLDALVPLGLAAVLAGGWVLAVRAAPPVEVLVAAGAPAGVPAALGPIRRDWGYVAGAYLLMWAPYAAARVAYGTDYGKSGSLAASALCALTLLYAVVGSLYGIGLLGRQLGAAQRLLREDAAAGRVHAVRVRNAGAVQENYRSPARTGVGKTDVSVSRWLELEADGAGDARPARLRAMEGVNFKIATGEKHLSQAASQLAGHEGWLCWHTRWKEIAATDRRMILPAAFVTDSGHVVWGCMYEEDWRPWLRGEAAGAGDTEPGLAAVHSTEPGRAAVPAPRPSRFTAAYRGFLSVLLAALLATVPYLLGLVPVLAAAGLAALSGFLTFFGAAILSGSGTDGGPDVWAVREELHPSLR
ncbi:hypothetical protein [Streptomyces sp. NBC_00203]|uniref:hypothetical protein n=1 Tax=Streptomyces sp. NBC_00203 TaxID=2975680 RepID=UPI003252ABE9